MRKWPPLKLSIASAIKRRLVESRASLSERVRRFSGPRKPNQTQRNATFRSGRSSSITITIIVFAFAFAFEWRPTLLHLLIIAGHGVKCMGMATSGPSERPTRAPSSGRSKARCAPFARKLAGPASALVRFRLDWPPGDQCGSSLALIDLLSSGWQLGGRMNQPELGANSFEQVARSS